MRRILQDIVGEDFGKKIQLISGPRQVGKTTLSQQIALDFQYLNYDRAEHRQLIQDAAWDRRRSTIIFDELHKMPQDLETVSNIQGIEQLIYVLAQSVGSIVFYSSLARTLQVSDKTVKKWLGILESLFVIFRVTPYAHKKSQVISKAPKFYFYDIARVEGHEGARFENLVALALQSELEFIKDTLGKELSLHFLRKKDGREIDFLIADRTNVQGLIECKGG